MPPIKRTKFKLAPEQLLEMFYWLKLIRAFDERLSILVKQGKVRSGVYTGIGQEAIIVGTCFGLRKEDFICPLHRDLGAFLMKGVEPRVMMSQMFAKETGLSKGRDSALHSGVSELGIFGNTSMLGANLPVAAGLGLTFKMEKVDNVVVAYFGEGASNVGDFHEALNFAGVQQLPIMFICENNQYAYSVPVEKSMAIDDVPIARRATDSTAWRSTATTCWRCIRRRWARSRGRAPARPDADRVQDLSLARPLGARQGVLPHGRRAGDVEEPRSDSDVHDLPARAARPRRREHEGRRSAGRARPSTRRCEFAMNAPDPKPEDAVTDLYAYPLCSSCLCVIQS